MSVQDCKLFDLLDGFEMTKSQHDWLERRFENMTKKESLLFRGAMQIEQPRMTCDVMLITSQLDHYDLFYGAGDDVQLGKFIMEQIQRPPDQAREFLDPEKVGSAYRQKGGNTFCDGHFIKVTSLIDPFLDGDPSMNPDKGDFAIRVKLASRTNMDGVWVGFPDTGEYMDAAHPDELLLALDELEAESLTECIAVEVDCCLSQLRRYSSPSMILPQSSSATLSTSDMCGRNRARANPDGWTSGRRYWSWRTATAWITPWTWRRTFTATIFYPATWSFQTTAKCWQSRTASIPWTNFSCPASMRRATPTKK